VTSTRVAVFGVVEGGVVVGRHWVAWIVTAEVSVVRKNRGVMAGGGRIGLKETAQYSHSNCVYILRGHA
jgi:hypothetical protein